MESKRILSPAIERFMLSLGIALLPVYVFGSGGIQPAHLIIALFAVTLLIQQGIPKAAWLSLLALISVYSILIEGFYSLIGGSPSSMMNGLFFFYNFFISSAIYLHCKNYGLSALAPGLLIASLIALGTILVSGVSLQESEQGRATGTFNNPNQLGYFSVCLLSLTYLLYRHKVFGYLSATFMFCVAIFMSIVSLSKAAMVANFLVVAFVLKPAVSSGMAHRKTSNVRSVLFWLSLVFALVLVLAWLIANGFFEKYLFVQRLARMAIEDDSSLGSRGYFVFLEGNAFQLVFGLGASLVTEIHGHEVHSTLASVLNNYGFIGLLLVSGIFTFWAGNLLRAYGFLGMACIAGPAMLYGITHNGIRFSIFWILLASSMAMSQAVWVEKNNYFTAGR